MMTQQPPELAMYQKLGELFYAIAAADKVIRKAEKDTLRNLVSSHWKNLDQLEDEFYTDASYQIEIVFDWLDDTQLDPNDCFEDFKAFKNEHPKLFTAQVNKLIWKTADAIAASFAGKNKAELIMLAKLKMLLENGDSNTLKQCN
ncbi:hypothetical protein [Marixanthomonas spongiae]|uniref:TerB family tellurite resistance protein n=1 Tax=Marixanthomonas spongiae TaxID=2174845 RepID=A0A2U0I4G8_9FLAO|nr:hypothetical protein [Marixanthomonas spongiae]PVW15880.1 hypothetical protein DDV96_06335 [Marixanthomonas spongiae]